MTAPAAIHELVEKFEQHRKEYQQHKNETELRREFLDPFFEALGWDVFNRKSYSERYKEVMHESSVEVEGQAKAADYAFRAGDRLIFFVEAKKPSVNIETNPVPAFQLRRYGWSAKLPINILTDFEQLAVYDCRAKPDKGDQVSLGRVKLYHYSDYVEKWDEIAGLFGREAVLRGALDQFVDAQKGKKGTTEVDDAFLEEIERWRDLLARNLALRNSSLNVRELNYAVQMTIDRIVFLRICEDRGIEPDEQLHEIAKKSNVYAELIALFKRADTKYNSGLFHFAEDTLTPVLLIDDKVLKDILHNLYYPESPYVFNYISADILGQVYERFLGKVIRLTAGHQAKVEEKPEVRKAGGVYYTPTYIVDYIVKNTIGKLVNGKTPENVTKLKFLDPACGSGSFLLGAYQYLLDWHLQWYTSNEPEKWARGSRPAIYQVAPSGPTGHLPHIPRSSAEYGGGQGGGWRLTTEEKKQILLANIHGVDIDAQAVEVTKLSLLLKVLEGASGQLRLGLERVLPDLSRNIQCGNSLIGPDYYEGRQMPMFGDDEFYRVNVFEWEKAFPAVFAVGGFDAVIGNPPYIRMETFKEIKDYLKAHYACHDERSDIYAYIIERAHKILKVGGQFGMIVSNKFLRANYGKPLRSFIQQNASIDQIVDFAGLPVFKGATVRTVVLHTSRQEQTQNFMYSPPLSTEVFKNIELHSLDIEKAIEDTMYQVPSSVLKKESWSFANENTSTILLKIQTGSISLEEYCGGKIGYGIKSGLEKAFILGEKEKNEIIQKDKASAEIIKPYLTGRDVRRYFVDFKQLYLIYTYHGIDIQKYPGVQEYLKPFKTQLQQRATKQEWFELQQPQFNYSVFFDSPKIVLPDIAIEPRFAFDDKGFYGATTIFFIPLQDFYLLGLLNSKLGFAYFKETCAALEGKKDIYLRFKRQYLQNFPVHKINLSNPPEKAVHDRLVGLVESMLALHKQSPRTPQEKDMLARQIESTDAAIDKLVYSLYGLTEEEIKVVEGR